MIEDCLSRREFIERSSVALGLAGCCHVHQSIALATESDDVTTDVKGHERDEDPRLTFLREITAATVEASRVRAGQAVAGMPANTTGGPLVRPGGRGAYPAFWVRDYAMSLDSGMLTNEECLHGLEMIALTQNGPDVIRMDTGATVPPYAIADHVNFDGKPVYYPGTYSSGTDQGGGVWGVLPPIDDHYYFIHAGYYVYRHDPDAAILTREVNGMTLLERMRRAFEASGVDPETGLAMTTQDQRAVGFGFCDTVAKTGRLLFSSLLRWRAALQLAEMCADAGEAEQAKQHQSAAERIHRHLPDVFGEPDRVDGWLIAATESCRQPDVWGTLFALELGVLPDPVAERARETVAHAVERGTIEYLGAVRHVPTDQDFSPTTAWERSAAALNRYQNGAYWHTPTGWLINSVRPVSAELSDRLLTRYIDHLRQEDFRQGPASGAPWECFYSDGQGFQNPVYKTSVTLPYALLKDSEG